MADHIRDTVINVGDKATMPLSYEITGESMVDAPPFADGCPNCRISVRVIPFATYTDGDTLHAFYNHGRCGKQWHTGWGAQWSHMWQRVDGSGDRSAIAA